MIQVLIISSLYSQTQHLRRILLGQAGHIQLCGTADNSVLGMSLIESLHLNTASINTWKNGVARALKQYIPDGTKAKEKCPNCGQETLVYQNNCPVCMSCGHSKCG